MLDKILIGAVALAVCAWLLTPSRLKPPAMPDASLDFDRLSGDTDPNIIPGAEKRVVWYDGEKKTEWSVVSIHGFSATRQETAPLAQEIATRLGANLFETRLAGHGLRQNALANATAEHWLRDTTEALLVGEQLGEKVILIGTSTGATLAAALLDHPSMQSVESLIMVSPNFMPHDPNSVWMTRPFGTLIARLVIGQSYSWEPHNDAQGLYWTTTYPTPSIVEMMRLVDLARSQLPASISQRLLVIHSNDDQVVSVTAIEDAYAAIDAPRKKRITIEDAEDPSRHVLAGDILSPNKTEKVKQSIVDFVLADSSIDKTPSL